MEVKNNSAARRQYNSIDLFKIFMAVCVVAIHTKPLLNYSNEVLTRIYDCLVAIAVPFFFLATGFLLGIKLKWPYNSQESINTIKSYLIKTVKLYFLWMAVYLPLAVYYCISSEFSFFKCILYFVRGVFLRGELYNSWMLWYLLSAVYSIVFILICLKRRLSPNFILAAGAVFILIGFGFDMLVQTDFPLPFALETLKKIVSVTIAKGRIFQGAFYIPCGMIIANKKFGGGYLVACSIALPASFAVNCVISAAPLNSILTVISAVSLFVIVKNINLKDSGIYPKIRKASTVMYFIHMYVWTFYYSIVYGKKTYGADCFLVTAGICFAVACVYIFVQDYIKSKNRSKIIKMD